MNNASSNHHPDICKEYGYHQITSFHHRTNMLKTKITITVFSLVACWSGLCLSLCNPAFADEGEQVINFEDHIKPIFRQHCIACHAADDKTSGLALDTYADVLEGGSGGASIADGDPSSSRLFGMIAHTEQPFMPPDEDPIPAEQQALIQKWIEQGMPENSGSKIKKRAVNLAAMAPMASGRPEGPPPMPETGLKQPPVYTERSAAISALSFSPWSPLLAVGGQEQVILYHMESAEVLAILPFPEGDPQSITFSRDGRLMLVGGGTHSVSGCAVIFDVKTGERITKVGDELDIVLAADINERNTKIALAGPRKMVRVFDVSTGDLIVEQKKHTDWINAVQYSPDGVLLATADRSNGLVVWEGETGRHYLDLVGHKGEIRAIDWRPDSNVLFSSAADGSVKMWDVNSGQTIKSIAAHNGPVTALNVCNNGTFVTAGNDNKIKIWDAGGNPKGELAGLPDQPLEVGISVDGRFAAAGDWSGNVRLWEIANPGNVKTLRANPQTIEMRIAGAQGRVQSLDQQLAQLSSDLESRRSAVATLTNKLTQTQQTFDATKTALSNSDSKTKQLKKSLAENDEKIAALKQQLIAAEKQKADWQSEMANEQQRLATLSSTSQSLETQLNQINTDLPGLQTALTAAQTAVDQVAQKLDSEKQKLSVARQDAVEFEARKNAVTAASQQILDKLSATQDELAAAKQATNSEKSTYEKLNRQIAQLQSQLNQIQSEMKSQEQQKSKAQKNLIERQTTVDRLSVQLESLQQDLLHAKEQKAIFDRAYSNE